MLIDSHAHLNFVDGLEDTLLRAQEAGVEKIITVATTIAESKNAANLALSCSRPGLDMHTTGLEVYTTCGFHPKDGKEDVGRLGLLRCIETLKNISKSSGRIVAIGECGLDYVTTDNKQGSVFRRKVTTDKEKEFQRKLFSAQIRLAAELNLPLVVHCRNGWDEIFELILKTKNQKSNIKGVFHSWTGDWDAAKKALYLGFYISFSGIVTFKNASDIREVAKKAPIEQILVETDSPFLAPEPLRGQRNEPKNVKIVAEFLASIRGQSLDIIIKQTSDNATRLFNLS